MNKSSLFGNKIYFYFIFAFAMSSTLVLTFAFLSLLSPAAMAVPSSVIMCSKPKIMNERGTTIQTQDLGIVKPGTVTINGTVYEELNYTEADLIIFVQNRNDGPMNVILKPYKGLRDYIGDVNIPDMQPGETRQIALRTWIAGQSYIGAVEIYYDCEGGGQIYPPPYFLVHIIGREKYPPPTSTCDSRDLDTCWSGMYRNYYCDENKNLAYTEKCTEQCCKKYGGDLSMCSSDGQTCYTANKLPAGTEGSIAFVCKDTKCNDGNERLLWFMLRLAGWDVTMRPEELWTEWELSEYDIIACVNSRACSIDFNSIFYNQHTNERKPFLEISNSKSMSAAYSFGYITSKRTAFGEEDPIVTSSDYITEGYSGSTKLAKKSGKHVVLPDSYFTSAVDSLIETNGLGRKGEHQSTMFKVKEDVDNGRYAFIGWLYDSTSLTTSGSVLLNRTLKWLKGGDAAFGGQNYEPQIKGEIAFVCQKDDCGKDNEEVLIKYLRQNGYSVVGKSAESWAFRELETYDLIVCSDSKTCKLEPGYAYIPESDPDAALYYAHMVSGRAFLEIPYNGGTAAAEAFGYVHSKSYRKTGYAIIPQGVDSGSDKIFSGFNGYMEVLSEKGSISGSNEIYLNPATNLANVPESGDKYGNEISAMFVSGASGSKGKYAYVGWVPELELLTENGEKLLLRTVNWLVCGDACLQSFDAEFGDLSFSFDVTSPTEQVYNTRNIYISLSSSQRAKEIKYSINGNREKRLCRECSALVKRVRAYEGQNELKIILYDYTGQRHERIINFFVNS